MSKNFFTELSRVLAEQGIETAPPEGNRLPILLGGQPACRVQSNGMLCIAPGDLTTPEASELYHKVAPFSTMVYEYTSLLERAPLLKSDSGNNTYCLLADFNGVVLAGKEKGRYGYQFATWRHDAEGAGYTQGEYFLNNYQSAKESFVRRTGLISPSRLFNDKQLTELYRCVYDTLDGNYELTDEQTTLLEKLSEQINSAVPDLHEQIAQAKQESYERQTQQFNM